MERDGIRVACKPCVTSLAADLQVNSETVELLLAEHQRRLENQEADRNESGCVLTVDA